MPLGPVDVIDFFTHPPIGLTILSTVSPSVLLNPYSGAGRLQVTVGIASAFGILWSVDLSPFGAGHTNRVITEWQDPILQLVVNYENHDGLLIQEAVVDTHLDEGFIFFDKALPSSVDYWIFPNFSMEFAWIIGA
jgi:hypothetical protein